MNVASSSSSSQQDESRSKIREGHLLRSLTFTVLVGTSDLGIGRYLFESLPNSSPPSVIFYESAATAYHENHELDSEVDRILSLAVDEGFEDGMENRTSQSLNLFIAKYPVAGIQQLITRMQSEHMNQGVSADIVRMLGQIQHAPSHIDRAYIAECLLHSELPLARDAAAVAIGDLADEHCIPALRKAVDAELIPALKADMQGSLDELMKSRDVVRSQET